MVVIPGCETSGRSGAEVRFSNILRTFFGFFFSVSGGVGSCGGWWILGQSNTTCSAVSSPIPYFPQMVSTARPILSSQYLSSVGGHFSDDPPSFALSLLTFILLCSQAFLLS